MKLIIVILSLSPFFANAQKVDLKDIDTNNDSTTIEISKNKKYGEKCDPIWEVQDGTSDLEGEPTVMAKDANANWKKACDSWKKEFRADNKENKIINLSCGKVECTSDAGGKVCKSTAAFKIKTKLN